MSRVETGQATAATATGGSAVVTVRVVDRRPAAAANDVPIRTRTTAMDRAMDPARGTRDIDDLPAGSVRGPRAARSGMAARATL